jgi:hypothetical protein
MTTLIAIHTFHRVGNGRILHIRPEHALEDLIPYMTPGATIHKLDDSITSADILAEVDSQLALGDFQRV